MAYFKEKLFYCHFLNLLLIFSMIFNLISLSIIYLYAPIKELSKQAKILSDRRRLGEDEQKIAELIKNNFINFDIFDVYFSYSPIEGVIYVC